MAKFINRVLGALDRIYGFDQGVTATDQLQLAPGIQLVHDVRREVELGAGIGNLGGYVWMPLLSAVHAALGNLSSQTDVWQALENAYPGLQKQRLWMWWIATKVNATSILLTSVDAYIANPVAAEPVPVGRNWLVFRGTTVAFSPVVGTVTLASVIPDFEDKKPLLVLPGAQAKVMSTASGAITLQMEWLFWVGPQGVLPPGVA